jgi:hypothetical protein
MPRRAPLSSDADCAQQLPPSQAMAMKKEKDKKIFAREHFCRDTHRRKPAKTRHGKQWKAN